MTIWKVGIIFPILLKMTLSLREVSDIPEAPGSQVGEQCREAQRFPTLYPIPISALLSSHQDGNGDVFRYETIKYIGLNSPQQDTDQKFTQVLIHQD